ncbi:MAG: hypothetical protein AB1331_08405 [Bacillota bacterium]
MTEQQRPAEDQEQHREIVGFLARGLTGRPAVPAFRVILPRRPDRGRFLGPVAAGVLCFLLVGSLRLLGLARAMGSIPVFGEGYRQFLAVTDWTSPIRQAS